jgi:hypothetical protein
MDAAVGQLRADGTLSQLEADALGRDLSAAPDGTVPGPTSPQEAVAFSGDPDLSGLIPAEITGLPVASIGLSGDEFLRLLAPAAPRVQRAGAALNDALAGRGIAATDLSLAFGALSDARGRSADVVLARVPGVQGEELLSDLAGFLVGDTSVEQEAVTVGGVAMTKVPSDRGGPEVPQTYLATTDEIAVAISARPPLLARLARSLLRP